VRVEVGVTTEVEDGEGLGVGVGVGVGVGDGVAAPTKLQEPVSTPRDSDPKKEKRLGERSSPPVEQPRHSSVICA